MASTIARGQQARLVTVRARDRDAVLREIARAKARFGLPESAAVFSCYEAGRDGFWLHRFLHHEGINNVIVDSSSIEVNRRARRAKADSLDAVSLVGLLVRCWKGETKVWSTVEVPDPADEDQRQLHPRRIVHAISAKGSGPVTTSGSHPSSRCTSFNLAAMSISCEQAGRQSPQPTHDVPFRVKAAYSLRARSRS